VLKAQILTGKAELELALGGARQAASGLCKALRIYEYRHALPLAWQARAALASLAARVGAGPA
jgi:hypothetical protein